jgi:hypothetical protein
MIVMISSRDGVGDGDNGGDYHCPLPDTPGAIAICDPVFIFSNM